MSNSLLSDIYSPWHSGYSRVIPVYSGKDGCLNHWISWNRGAIVVERPQQALPPPVPGDNAVDVTEKSKESFGDEKQIKPAYPAYPEFT